MMEQDSRAFLWRINKGLSVEDKYTEMMAQKIEDLELIG
jgi:hypothetical protein